MNEQTNQVIVDNIIKLEKQKVEKATDLMQAEGIRVGSNNDTYYSI